MLQPKDKCLLSSPGFCSFLSMTIEPDYIYSFLSIEKLKKKSYYYISMPVTHIGLMFCNGKVQFFFLITCRYLRYYVWKNDRKRAWYFHFSFRRRFEATSTVSLLQSQSISTFFLCLQSNMGI